MRENYRRKDKKRTSRRARKSIHSGIRLFIMIALVAWGGFNLGARSWNRGSGENPYNTYAKNIWDMNVGPIDEQEREQGETGAGEVAIDDWRILLVNADNPIPEGYTFELSNIDNLRKFDSRAIGDLIEMIDECRDQTGCSIWAQSAYRDRQYQEALYSDEVSQYIERGRSKEEAERLASGAVSAPGTSEHEIGLAVDFNHVDLDFENSTAFKWLIENSPDYGFILRYPKDKQSITGVMYEPWHFRYVGEEHAKIMTANNLCLEEYIEYLIENDRD